MKNSFNQKQNVLLNQVNNYLIENTDKLQRIPTKAFIIPVTSNDHEYFSYSMTLIKEAVRDQKKNIIIALLLNKDHWIFQRVIQ